MPVQTAIQVRRGTAASWTSTNPTLAAGEIGFETDTGKFKIGTGSTAWASLAYAAIDAGLLAAKGDLVTATANDTPAVLTVGSNGETLVADSSASTGLRWQGNFAAGKNKVINGDFGIWQRGTSFTVTSPAYTADRWFAGRDGNGTYTLSQQTFTPGTAPVAGYEGQYFAQLACTSVGTSTYVEFSQPVEDVRTFAGQTVTVSFWARLSAGSVSGPYVRLNQYFGSGGSAQVTGSANTFTPTSSWQRFSATVTLPSISGKTIGTGSYLNVNIIVPTGGATGTVQFWGVQLEAGNTATAFQTATGTLAGERSACERYYYRTANAEAFATYGNGYAISSVDGYFYFQFPTTMRVKPSSIDYSNLAAILHGTGNYNATSVTIATSTNSTTGLALYFSGMTGLTANRPYNWGNGNSTAGYIGFNAEL